MIEHVRLTHFNNALNMKMAFLTERGKIPILTITLIVIEMVNG